jgi:small-conductance mechanosensitive channel
MSEWASALGRPEWPYVLGAALVLSALLHRFLAADRAVVRHSLLFFAFWLLLDLAAAVLAQRQPGALAAGLHEAALLGFGVVLIRLAGLALFRVLLPRLGVHAPRILEDIVVIGGYLLWGLVRLTYAGVELSSLVATSAVITAVVAFAMQDTLGNILGGLALQLDNSLEIGDWVKVDDVSGRVVEIQWRFTAILTRNGERVVVPNAQLMKSKFSVVGSRDAGTEGWRRWIWFDLDYGANPSQVIAAAERAVSDAEIPNVARRPPPSCVAMAFGPGAMRYALRYWMLDPRDDDLTDSAVRTHLLATVQRNGWRIALPDQRVHVVEDSEAHREAAWRRELARRLQALAGIELFASLDEGERLRIAERLVHAPFARGDVITRQGAIAHWLYIVVEGEAEVYWEAPTGERRQVARLPAGSVFGEMGLMTGTPRAATVVAASDVECYRLDKAGFQDVIRGRPAIAEGMSHILEQRQREIDEMHSGFRPAPSDGGDGAHRVAILARIREFFGLR